MNTIIFHRYKNEIILSIAIIFATYASYYKISSKNYVDENRVIIKKQISEIVEIESYKRQWKNGDIAKRVKIFKTIVNNSKVKRFYKKSSKVTLSFINLTTNDLNKITNKLLNMPIQIVKLKIEEKSKNKFTMEFTCKW